MDERIKNPYDKVIKEVFLKSSLIIYIGDFEVKEVLPDLQFEPQTKYVDSLFLIYDKKTQMEKVLHIEFQSGNDHSMTDRMFDYFTMIRTKYRQAIIQCLFYLGSSPMTMANTIKEDNLSFQFTLINLSDIAFRDLLNSEKAGDVILSLLGNFGDKKKEEAIFLVLEHLQKICKEKESLKRHFEFVTLLGKLRKLDYIINDEVKKIMIDIDYKDSVIYQDGKIEGKLEGKIESARAMKADGMAIDKIAAYTGLPISEIKKL